MESQSGSEQDRGSSFPPTHWTLILESAGFDPVRAAEALEKLFTLYRQPIVNWFRRHDNQRDPEDLAHDFIECLLKANLLSRLTEKRGRFRFFLVKCMRNFLHDVWDRAAAQKRGGQAILVPLEDDDAEGTAPGNADAQLDLDFALVIHRKVMAELAPAAELRPYLFQKDATERWGDISARLGRTAVAVRKDVSRLRRSHWEQFRDEVAQIATPADKKDETRYLYDLLFKNLAGEA